MGQQHRQRPAQASSQQVTERGGGITGGGGNSNSNRSNAPSPTSTASPVWPPSLLNDVDDPPPVEESLDDFVLEIKGRGSAGGTAGTAAAVASVTASSVHRYPASRDALVATGSGYFVDLFRNRRGQQRRQGYTSSSSNINKREQRNEIISLQFDADVADLFPTFLDLLLTGDLPSWAVAGSSGGEGGDGDDDAGTTPKAAVILLHLSDFFKVPALIEKLTAFILADAWAANFADYLQWILHFFQRDVRGVVAAVATPVYHHLHLLGVHAVLNHASVETVGEDWPTAPAVLLCGSADAKFMEAVLITCNNLVGSYFCATFTGTSSSSSGMKIVSVVLWYLRVMSKVTGTDLRSLKRLTDQLVAPTLRLDLAFPQQVNLSGVSPAVALELCDLERETVLGLGGGDGEVVDAATARRERGAFMKPKHRRRANGADVASLERRFIEQQQKSYTQDHDGPVTVPTSDCHVVVLSSAAELAGTYRPEPIPHKAGGYEGRVQYVKAGTWNGKRVAFSIGPVRLAAGGVGWSFRAAVVGSKRARAGSKYSNNDGDQEEEEVLYAIDVGGESSDLNYRLNPPPCGWRGADSEKNLPPVFLLFLRGSGAGI